jgi:SAM-dependent methyltransferase
MGRGRTAHRAYDQAVTDASEELQAFVQLAPLSRAPILKFLQRAASETPADSMVLDVGAGDAPYRELFSNVRYTTCDWENSIYTPPQPPDIISPADRLPLEDGSVDAVLCTQVLEHVPEPWAVLEEFHRVLRPGGKLWLTAPLVWFLHEQPYDYYRFTSHGIRSLLERAGFLDIDITPQQDAFLSLQELLESIGYMIGRSPDGFDDQRELVSRMMTQLASVVGSFSGFDTQWILPLNYAAEASKAGL